MGILPVEKIRFAGPEPILSEVEGMALQHMGHGQDAHATTKRLLTHALRSLFRFNVADLVRLRINQKHEKLCFSEIPRLKKCPESKNNPPFYAPNGPFAPKVKKFQIFYLT